MIQIKKLFILFVLFSFLFTMYFVPNTHAKRRSKPGPTIAPDFVVGALLRLSGEGSYKGKAIQEALKLAAKNINQILSRQKSKVRLTLLIKDTHGQADIALQKLEFLHQQGVKVVIGPQTSEAAAQLLKYANKNGVLLVSPTSEAASLARPGDNLFRFTPDTSMQAKFLAGRIAQEGLRSAVVVYRDDVWGVDLSKAMKIQLAKNKVSVLSMLNYESQPKGFNGDYKKLLGDLLKIVSASKEKHALDQTAVVLLGFHETVAIFIDANRNALLKKVRWFGSSAMANNPELIRDADAADFAATTGYQSPLFSSSLKDKRSKQVSNLLRGKLKNRPDAQTLAAYDALMVVTKAYLITGLTKMKPFKKALMDEANSYSGLTGQTVLNKAGDRSEAEFDIWSVKKLGGRYVWKIVN